MNYMKRQDMTKFRDKLNVNFAFVTCAERRNLKLARGDFPSSENNDTQNTSVKTMNNFYTSNRLQK